jgi:hypothetical protein
MTATSGQQAGFAFGPPSAADRALLLAMQAWAEIGQAGGPDGRRTGGDHDFVLRFWDWLDPTTVQRLCASWDHDVKHDDTATAQAALQRLRKLHGNSARVDLSRAHASWWVRALKEESPAVQRIITASVPEFIRGALQSGLLLDSDDLKTERAPSAEVVSWVTALWTERLVGGETERPDDSLAVVVLTRLSPRSGHRLCRMAGLAKLVLTGQEPGRSPGALARRQWLRDQLTAADAELVSLARQDLESARTSQVPRRHRLARLGLPTIARLLSGCEPVRLRWAMQHWPYPLAKLIRSLMPPEPGRPPLPVRLDLLILKTAWDRLNLEGNLAMPWPSQPGDSAPGT